MPILGVAGDIKPRSSKKNGQTRRDGIRRKQCPKRPKETREQRTTRRRAAREARRSRVNEKWVVPYNAVGHGRFRQFQLYALRLETGKFYVGMTAYWDAQKRMDEHLNGKGAKWTSMYLPIEIIETRQLGEVYESQAAKAENDMTVEYMLEHGTEIVRGGDMCYIDHKKTDKRFREHVRRQLTDRKVED